MDRKSSLIWIWFALFFFIIACLILWRETLSVVKKMFAPTADESALQTQ